MSFSRTQFPPNGWVFHQPQTNWSSPTPGSSTFDQTVVLIIKHRLANPAITAKHGLATDAFNVGNELERFTKTRLGIPDAPVPKPQPPPPSPAPVVGVAVAAVKKLAAGAALLMEWEQSGQAPVASELSTARAAVCASCPCNSPITAMSEWFTLPVANAIRARLGRLHQMNLTTPHDSKLGVCSACLCPLGLKVHTPLNLIEKKLKPEFAAQLDPRCWIKSELAAVPK